MVKFCKSTKCLKGRTAIITGANTGIGYETALEFAKRGCRIILACRNEERANEAHKKLVDATGNESLIVKLIDLESLDSVKQFASDINSTEERLDILVNNAGMMGSPKRTTVDGFEGEMQTNYLSPFLLTVSLLDLLKKSAPSRIVNVSSSMAKFASLDIENINKHTGSTTMYSNTKLCNIFFTMELARRLEGTNVTTYSLHPGAVRTELQRHYSTIITMMSKFFLTPEEGAQTSIYCSLQEGIEELNGKHFENSQPVSYCKAKDTEKAKKLWEITEDMLGLKS